VRVLLLVGPEVLVVVETRGAESRGFVLVFVAVRVVVLIDVVGHHVELLLFAVGLDRRQGARQEDGRRQEHLLDDDDANEDHMHHDLQLEDFEQDEEREKDALLLLLLSGGYCK
jgi:hypothetical protein